MVAPPAMVLESALDMMKDRPAWLVEDQQKELSSLGDVRVQRLGATGLSDDFRKGYEFGLMTIRVLLMMNPAAIQAKVDI